MQIETESIALDSKMPLRLYFPSGGNEKLPCVILMHERYGLVEHTVDLARALASEGYCVATPDLFYFIEDQESLHAGSTKATPSDPYVLGQLDEVVDALAKHPRTLPDKLAVIGVCQTGRYAVIYGAKRRLQASIVLYGAISDWEKSDLRPEHMEEIISQLDAPLLGLYGEIDHSISIPQVVNFRNVLEQFNKSYRIKIYEDAPHGWLNSTMPGRYRKVAAENAFYEVVRFLKQHLSQTSLRPNRVVWEFESNKDANYDFSKNVRFE